MTVNILLFIAGAALVIFGADWLVDGAASIARRFGLSEYVIGATIIGIGTSMPEFVVSSIAAFGGNADIAIGNVAGSNIFNTLLILGITALIRPLHYTKRNNVSDIPVCLAVTAILLVFSVFFHDGSRSIMKWEGTVLFAGFVAYMIWSFRSGKENATETPQEKDSAVSSPLWKSSLLIIAGIASLIFGGDMFVDSASSIASAAGVSQSVIAATLMAGGTSLPELAVCVAAALKGREQMAIGNIIGSNISNILLIVGFAGMVSATPMKIDAVNFAGVVMALVSVVALTLSILPLRTSRLSRIEAAVLLALYASYLYTIL